MRADMIFYADPRNHVIVSEQVFVINDKEYKIQRIREHFVRVMRPVLLPGIVGCITGIYLILAGAMETVSFHFMPETTILGTTISGVGWAIVAGIFLLVGGVLMVFTSKPHHALHIRAGDEDTDVLVTEHQDYVMQITNALNRAFLRRRETLRVSS